MSPYNLDDRFDPRWFDSFSHGPDYGYDHPDFDYPYPSDYGHGGDENDYMGFEYDYYSYDEQVEVPPPHFLAANADPDCDGEPSTPQLICNVQQRWRVLRNMYVGGGHARRGVNDEGRKHRKSQIMLKKRRCRENRQLMLDDHLPNRPIFNPDGVKISVFCDQETHQLLSYYQRLLSVNVVDHTLREEWSNDPRAEEIEVEPEPDWYYGCASPFERLDEAYWSGEFDKTPDQDIIHHSWLDEHHPFLGKEFDDELCYPDEIQIHSVWNANVY